MVAAEPNKASQDMPELQLAILEPSEASADRALDQPPQKLCGCGCGEPISPYTLEGFPRKYVKDHSARIMHIGRKSRLIPMPAGSVWSCWTVVGPSDPPMRYNGISYYRCICSTCGLEKNINGSHLRKFKSLTCRTCFYKKRINRLRPFESLFNRARSSALYGR
jgi:hypothetical protein